MKRILERSEPLLVGDGHDSSVRFKPAFGCGRLRIFAVSTGASREGLEVLLSCSGPGRDPVVTRLGWLTGKCEEWVVPSVAAFKSYELEFHGEGQVDLLVVEEEPAD